jgi:radical SAM protein with 4Fe4S-binding SPASM domain
MANISITRRCRGRCSYCFAKHELTRDLTTDMSSEIYEAALRFLEHSRFPEVRLLGGEPTEHPRFNEYVNRARKRGFRVVVFSGGLVPQTALEHIATLPMDNFSLVLNTANPSKDQKSLVNRQRDLCRTLGSKITLGVNIWSPDQDTAHLFDWMDEYGSCRRIRVGVAHPIWGGTNEFFRLRGPRVVPLFESLFAKGAERNVNVDFDCGFTPCMFSRDFVNSHPDMFMPVESGCYAENLQSADCDDFMDDDLSLQTGRVVSIGMRCNPVVDILPEGDCIACYALSRFRRFPMPTGGTLDDLHRTFINELLPMLPVGIHRECAYCDYLARDMCGGGCRARRALRLRPNALIPLNPAPTGDRDHTHGYK